MPESVVVAIVGTGGSLLGSFVGLLVSNKLITYRLEQLEKKVDKHNHLVDRVYCLERRVSLNEEKIKVENHRIDDLEDFHK